MDAEALPADEQEMLESCLRKRRVEVWRREVSAAMEAIKSLRDGKFKPQPAESIYTAPSTGPLLLGMSAAAKFLGVSRATLWRMIQGGLLQKVEILPGSFRFRRVDLEMIAAGQGKLHRHSS